MHLQLRSAALPVRHGGTESTILALAGEPRDGGRINAMHIIYSWGGAGAARREVGRCPRHWNSHARRSPSHHHNILLPPLCDRQPFPTDSPSTLTNPTARRPRPQPALSDPPTTRTHTHIHTHNFPDSPRDGITGLPPRPATAAAGRVYSCGILARRGAPLKKGHGAGPAREAKEDKVKARWKTGV